MTTGASKLDPVAEDSPTAGGNMESRKLCAYNQTRECFLGLEVVEADVSLRDDSETCLVNLSLQSGEGLWMSPFRGIPDRGISSSARPGLP
jgi:hypothetical protein